MATEDTYNGWTNRETWLVNVWFNPESREDVQAARETLEDEEQGMSGCMRDMSGLDRVNWYELEAAFDEDEDDEDEES